jgi:hypothetical protein
MKLRIQMICIKNPYTLRMSYLKINISSKKQSNQTLWNLMAKTLLKKSSMKKVLIPPRRISPVLFSISISLNELGAIDTVLFVV